MMEGGARNGAPFRPNTSALRQKATLQGPVEFVRFEKMAAACDMWRSGSGYETPASAEE
jgi:hypothetical protein